MKASYDVGLAGKTTGRGNVCAQARVLMPSLTQSWLQL